MYFHNCRDKSFLGPDLKLSYDKLGYLKSMKCIVPSLLSETCYLQLSYGPYVKHVLKPELYLS